MTSLSDNPALADPFKALTPRQREAVLAIDHFRFQKPLRHGGWAVGSEQFKFETIQGLRAKGLVVAAGRKLNLTQAGKLALDKLKERIR